MSAPQKGTPEYDAWRQKISNSKSGKPSHMKGKTHTEEARAKIREARAKQTFSDETKAKISESGKGRQVSAETRQKISDAQKGKPRWDEEGRAMMSATRKGRKHTEETKAKMKGRKLSEDQKAKLIARNTGRVVSPETRAKISASEKGKIISEETRAKSRAWWATLSYEERMERLGPVIAKAFTTAGPTSLEVIVREILETSGVLFEEQKQIGHYFADFFLPEKNIIIEAMGCYWHGCLECGHDSKEAQTKRNKDKRRGAYLQKCGYIVHYIWEHDLKRNPLDALKIILN